MIRNFGNLGSNQMYTKAFVGTKHLIDDFITQSVKCLTHLHEVLPEDSNKELLLKISYFTDLRHELGNTALILSGGANLGKL